MRVEFKVLTVVSRFGVLLLAYFMVRIMGQIDLGFIEVNRDIQEIRTRGEGRDARLAELMLEIEHRITKLEARG